jgi:hypothetical protein
MRDWAAKECSYYHDHEPDGPTTYHCFSRAQLGTATEKITEGEGAQTSPGIYRFGRWVADVTTHRCTCGYWASCWHLAAALLLESGLRVLPGVLQTQGRYAQARRARWEREEREQSGEFIASEIEDWLQQIEQP